MEGKDAMPSHAVRCCPCCVDGVNVAKFRFNAKFKDVLRSRFIGTFGLILKHSRFINFNGFLITLRATGYRRVTREVLGAGSLQMMLLLLSKSVPILVRCA